LNAKYYSILNLVLSNRLIASNIKVCVNKIYIIETQTFMLDAIDLTALNILYYNIFLLLFNISEST